MNPMANTERKYCRLPTRNGQGMIPMSGLNSINFEVRLCDVWFNR